MTFDNSWPNGALNTELESCLAKSYCLTQARTLSSPPTSYATSRSLAATLPTFIALKIALQALIAVKLAAGASLSRLAAEMKAINPSAHLS